MRPFPTIAGELGVSVNTVKTQAKSIYRKLGVHDRTGAVTAWAPMRDGARLGP